jgi:AraC family transcriptional regulator
LGTIFHDLCHRPELPSASFIESVGTALASRTLELHFHANRRELRRKPGIPEETLNSMVKFIDAHVQESITVAQLARHAAMGVDHFARLLKNTTGISPLQFLIKCRVEKALELLRTGKFRVGEVACQVGFCDQSHLDRHCRKIFGCAPKTAITAHDRVSF